VGGLQRERERRRGEREEAAPRNHDNQQAAVVLANPTTHAIARADPMKVRTLFLDAGGLLSPSAARTDEQQQAALT
jgi:hypothetical protein